MAAISESDPLTALERLKAGRAVYGLAQTWGSVALTEQAYAAGFDFVMLDCQNGGGDEAAYMASIAFLRKTASAFAAVRVKPEDGAAAAHYAQLGADVILMPEVRSAEEARAFVSATGKGVRAKPLLFAMIETGDADVDAIADVEGLAGLVIGPTDLSADLGQPDDFATAEYRLMFAKVETAARTRDLILGSKPHPGYPGHALIEAGHTFILATSDIRAMGIGLTASLREAKGAEGEAP